MISAVHHIAAAVAGRLGRWAQHAPHRALEGANAAFVLALVVVLVLAVRYLPPAGIAVCVLAVAGVAVAWTRALVRPLRHARREIAASERRYRRLYEEVAAGVISLAADGAVTAANPACRRMLGVASLAELQSVDFAEDVYAGPGTYLALLARARAGGEVANVEVRLRRQDGAIVTGLATLAATWNDDGDCIGYECTLVDVSDRKLAESQRRSTELRFRRLFESNAVGVLFGNLRRGSLDDANDALLSMLGLRRTELPAALAPFTPDEFLAADRRAVMRLRRDGHVEPFEKEFLTRDGRRLPVLISAAIVDAHEGDFIGFVIDRTAEIAAARRVAETKAFYELLLDSVPTRIARIDLDERVVYCNRAYREWCGDAQGSVGRTLHELLGPERRAGIASQIERARAGEKLRFVSWTERNGRTCALDTAYAPLCDANGRVTGFLSFVHDATFARGEDGNGGALRDREVA